MVLIKDQNLIRTFNELLNWIKIYNNKRILRIDSVSHVLNYAWIYIWSHTGIDGLSSIAAETLQWRMVARFTSTTWLLFQHLCGVWGWYSPGTMCVLRYLLLWLVHSFRIQEKPQPVRKTKSKLDDKEGGSSFFVPLNSCKLITKEERCFSKPGTSVSWIMVIALDSQSHEKVWYK